MAAVGGKEGLLYLSTPGNFTYGEPAPILQYNPPMTNTVSQYPHSQTVWEWGYVSQFLCNDFLIPDSEQAVCSQLTDSVQQCLI